MELTFEEIRELLVSVNQTDIEELTLKSDAFELTVRKSTPHRAMPLPQPTFVASDPAAVVSPPPMMPPNLGIGSPPPSSGPDSKFLEITSPMVGTFYRAPAPDEAPFVEVGDRITTGQTVCIIEAMKLMNELESEFSGEIVEILVENAEPVEFGQVLIRVKPN